MSMISSFLRNTSLNPTSAALVSSKFSLIGTISLFILVILAAAVIPHGDLFKQFNRPSPACCIVVDCGFSFTHVVPILENKVVWNAVKRCGFPWLFRLLMWHASIQVRVDVGGKLLTNHLKELVSYRQWNMMDETFIVNDVKEKCCFVSQNLKSDLETCTCLMRSATSRFVLTISSCRQGRPDVEFHYTGLHPPRSIKEPEGSNTRPYWCPCWWRPGFGHE